MLSNESVPFCLKEREFKMKNFVQSGNVLEFAAPYDVVSGAGAQIGTMFGVACVTMLSGVRGNFAVAGVFNLKKVGSQAWTEGLAIYWDNSAKQATATASTNIFIGWSTEVVGNGAGVVLGNVKLAVGVVIEA